MASRPRGRPGRGDVAPSVAGRELAEPRDRPAQPSGIEDVGRRVRDVVDRPVEAVRAPGGVDRVPHRDLVTDAEDGFLRAAEQTVRTRPRSAARRRRGSRRQGTPPSAGGRASRRDRRRGSRLRALRSGCRSDPASTIVAVASARSPSARRAVSFARGNSEVTQRSIASAASWPSSCAAWSLRGATGRGPARDPRSRCRRR